MKRAICLFMCVIFLVGIIPIGTSASDSDFDFLIGDWKTSDGVALSFYDNNTFTLEWGYFPEEEGEWNISDCKEESCIIDMNGSSILSSMMMVYGAASSNYHFEILKCNEDNFYLVQVYGDYTAQTSSCKLGFTRVGAERNIEYTSEQKSEKHTVSQKQFSYNGYTVNYKDDYFFEDSTVPNNDLAMFCGVLSWAVYHDADKPSIQDVYEELGIPEDDYYDNAVYRDKSLRFSIAKKTLTVGDEETNLLIVVARGTVNEAISDHYTQANSDFFGYKAYDLIYDFESSDDDQAESIINELNHFLDEHPDIEQKPLKVVFTGHSLGGAATNLLAARFNRFADSGAWWSEKLDKKDIFCYTFGAIDSIKSDGTVSSGYENLHNITNFHDSFGPAPQGWLLFTAAGNSRYGKFGHIDLFDTDKDKGKAFSMDNHMMDVYLDAVRDNIIEYENPKNQKIVRLDCPIDIQVFDGDKLVGKVVNDTVDETVTTIPLTVVDSSKFMLLQDGKDYRVTISATDKGTMDYSVSHSGVGTSIKGFRDVVLTKGKAFSGIIGDGSNASDIRLYVVDENDHIIAEVMEDGKEVAVNSDQTVSNPSAISAKMLIIIIIAAVLFIIILTVLIIALKRKKRQKNSGSASTTY